MGTCFALSALQQGMLVQSIDKRVRNCYIVQTVFEWRETICLSRFSKAWEVLASRHEVLRSCFRWHDTSTPQQVILPDVAIDFEVKKLYTPDEPTKQAELQAFLEADLRRGFSLSVSPPWRVTVLECDGSLIAVWTLHHLLLDGRSHVLLLRDLLAIYDGQGFGLTASRSQRHYIEWLATQNFLGFEPYWKTYLAAASLPTPLPPLSSDAPSASGHLSYTSLLGRELTHNLKCFSSNSGTSVGNVIQASWGFILGWLAGETDVVIGGVRACRKAGVQNGDGLIGLMINTLPLRMRWQKETSIADVLGCVSRDWNQFRKYEHTPLQQIRKWIALPAGQELFTTAVSFSSAQFLEAVIPDEALRARRHIWLRQTTPYCSLDLGLLDEDAEIRLTLPSDLLEPSLACQLPEFLRNTIREVIQDPSRPVTQLSPLNQEQRAQVTLGCNSRWEEPPAAIEWIDRISAQAHRVPESAAIVHGDQVVSWRNLEESSNQLARLLLSRGLKPDDLVAVYLPRSPEFIWTCLAILKAGGAYLPLDTKWPAQRISKVLADAKPFTTITAESFEGLWPAQAGRYWIPQQEMTSYPVTRPETVIISPDHLAYVIYTSGSSGIPKGVEIFHRGLQNLIDDMVGTFSLGSNDRGSFLSNTAFDASVHEVWPLLAASASVHITQSMLLIDPAALLNWIDEERISFSFMSVIMAEAIIKLARGRKLALRYLLTGGDQLRVAFSDGLSFQFVNEYGPTEYTVVATRFPVARSFGSGDAIPIGTPIRGTRAYVMNSSHRLLPHGVPGELVLAGNGIARGYRNRSELSAEKFISNCLPEEISAKLYRTGDLVRWTTNGDLQFLGRIDSQVKLRGFRIELGEIETCLLKHPEVAEAVVIFKRDPVPSLIAFLIPKQHTLKESLKDVLPAYLKSLLPEYMLPSKFVFVDHLPTTTSGKYDRKELSSIPLALSDPSPPAATFTSAAEEQMAEIWKDVLHLPSVHSSDHFLSLGGTSLSIMQLITAVERKFGAELPVAELLRNPTPADLARLVESDRPLRPKPLITLRSQGNQSPLYCIPGAAGGVHWFRDLAETLDCDRPIIGVELLALSTETQEHFSVEGAAHEIAELIDSSKSHDECSLCGFSGGGLLALEVAGLLTALGMHVRNVLLLEAYPPPSSPSRLAKAQRWIQGWWSLPAGKQMEALRTRLDWLRRAAHPSSNIDLSIPQHIADVKERHISAFVTHRLRPYAGPLHLFFAEDRPLSVGANPSADWSRLLDRPLSPVTVILPGNHYSLFTKGNMERLATHFKYILSDMSGTLHNAASRPLMDVSQKDSSSEPIGR